MVNQIESLAPFQLSTSALNELKRLFGKKKGDTYLRIGAKSGGCTGLSYILELDTKTEKDTIYVVDGLPIIIDAAHLIYIRGILIDWSDGLNARGFAFKNPNASEICGCGTSFAV